MNQILVTEKLYVTPELKRKKKIYRFCFILSVIIIIGLISFYIYSEYKRNKDEEISQDILSEIESNNVPVDEEMEETWEIIVSTIETDAQAEEETEATTSSSDGTQYGTYAASDGNEYETVGTIKIPIIDLSYPILAETTTELLKISPCKFYGPNPNEVGNLCIAGHNYKNDKFFSNVSELDTGDIIKITDTSGTTLSYSVYDMYVVDPEDTSCTSQLTDGKKIVTLITCTDDNEQRYIVQAKEIT